MSFAEMMYTWGDGGFGQLGHNDRNSHRAPRQVEPWRFGGERVLFVAAGGNLTVAVTAGGAAVQLGGWWERSAGACRQQQQMLACCCAVG